MDFYKNLYNYNYSEYYLKTKAKEGKKYFCDFSDDLNTQCIYFSKYNLLEDEYIQTGLKDLEGCFLLMSYNDDEDWKKIDNSQLVQLIFGLMSNAVVNFQNTTEQNINPIISEFLYNLYYDIIKLNFKKAKKKQCYLLCV